MLRPDEVIYDRPWAQVGRLPGEDGQCYIRKVGKHVLSDTGLGIIDFLTKLTADPHPNLLVPIGFSGGAGEVLVEDYPDLSGQIRLDGAGREIRKQLSKGRIGIGKVIDMMVQLSDGVDFIHRSGYVHRDVRRENVFVEDVGEETEWFRPTLFDYNGMVRPFFLEEGLKFANDETPPEERLGRVMVDGRHDVYQLGWMLRALTHYQGALDVWQPVAPVDQGITDIIGCATGPHRDRYPEAGEFRDRLLEAAGS